MRFLFEQIERIAVSLKIDNDIETIYLINLDVMIFLFLLSSIVSFILDRFFVQLTFYCRRLCELIWHRLPRRPINHYRR